jgi:hypothetical protein
VVYLRPAATEEHQDKNAFRLKRGKAGTPLTLSTAFIAPDLTKAAMDGRLPRGTGVTSLREAPAAAGELGPPSTEKPTK